MPATDEKFVTALYGRTSKDDPKKVTIERQQEVLRDWAARDPLVASVHDEYMDKGVSGKIPLWERPQGRRLLADVRAGKVRSAAVAYVDRFGRTLLDGLQAVKALEDQGVKLVAAVDGWDARRNDSPLYFQFRMMIAEEEHRRIRERMECGKVNAMKRDNAPPGGPLVFGYRIDAQGRFLPDPVEAPVVIRMFEMCLEGAKNTEILAWALTLGLPAGRRTQKRAAGSEREVVKCHRDSRWHLTRIGSILRNPVYRGERRWGGQLFACIPLVDMETFERVQAVLSRRPNTHGGVRTDGSTGLLSGVLRCAACHSPFYHQPRSFTHKGKRYDYRVYVCDGNRHNRGCRSKKIRVDQLDADVWDFLTDFLADPEAAVRKILEADTKLGGQTAEVAAREANLLAEIGALDGAAAEVWAEQRARGWPLSFVTGRLDELNARRESLLADLAAVRRQLAGLELGRGQSEQVMALLAGFRADLAAGASPRRQYEIVRALVAGGTVTTTGSGRHKHADVEIQLYWGESLKARQSLGHKLLKECYYESQCAEIGTVPVTFTLGA